MNLTQHVNKTSIFVSLLSFSIGTVLVLAQLFWSWDALIGIGIYFLITAVLVNTVVLIPVLINILTNTTSNRENVYTVFVSLCNIPIALIYFLIVIKTY